MSKDAVLVAGPGAVSGVGVRLLAGAGCLPALTRSDLLEGLFIALSGVLDYRGAE